MFKRILVPVDFSPRSAAALSYAIKLAREQAAVVDLLTVVAPASRFKKTIDAALGNTIGEVPQDVLVAAHARLSELLASVEHAGCEVNLFIEPGDAAASIVRLATEGKHDLVVIGTHGRFGVAQLLLGSVAQTVTTCAPCPVLVLRA